MKDMLVRLTDLPDVGDLEKELLQKGIVFRKPIAPEKQLLVQWTEAHFSSYWASEVDVSFLNGVVNCYIAQQGNEPIGFACYDTTAKNFFGPTGVLETHRRWGVGKVLLLKALEALKEMGYAYAIIGGVGPAGYYEKTVGATLIKGSEKGIYANMLRKDA